MTPIGLTAAWVAKSSGGVLTRGAADAEFVGVSIDTRTMRPGELFVAIRGERFDGAAFAQAALDAAAGGVMVPPGLGLSVGPTQAVIEVGDTTAGLQALARAMRRESGAKVVAITGSAGKTTTKEVTSEFLAARYRVIRNRGNFNNHIGLPLSLIDLRQRPDVAVVELGMNHAGEIRTLVSIAEPEVRVWTNVGEAHLGFFASVDAIADAKAEVLEGATPETLLVANADDARIMARVPRFGGRVVTFGIDREAEVRATDVADLGIYGMRVQVTARGDSAAMTIPLVGRANLSNVLAATAVALALDVPLSEIARRAAHLRPASHRGEILRLRNGATVIDDSYNANPSAMKRALEVLAAASADRRIAVLGEMLELGDHADRLHAEVGRAAKRSGVDLLVGVGGAPADVMVRAAVQDGMAPGAVRHFSTSDEAAPAVAGLIRSGDVVLVKGSRGVKTERVVDALKAAQG